MIAGVHADETEADAFIREIFGSGWNHHDIRVMTANRLIGIVTGLGPLEKIVFRNSVVSDIRDGLLQSDADCKRLASVVERASPLVTQPGVDEKDRSTDAESGSNAVANQPKKIAIAANMESV
jgi:hypothetical protein